MTQSGATYRSYLDRQREVLITAGDSASLREDLELHLIAAGVRQDSWTLDLLEDGLAAMALYMLSRPRFRYFGWTVHLQEPLLNLFVAGMATEGAVVGRAFHEGVERVPGNLFYAQTSRPFGDVQTSSVEVEGIDIFRIVEQYCSKSDQQPVRFFRGEARSVAMVTALPGSDSERFGAMGDEEVTGWMKAPETKLIAEREIVFRCGCDKARIAKLVAELYREDPEDLFRGDPAVEVQCPRCGTTHFLTREEFDSSSVP